MVWYTVLSSYIQSSNATHTFALVFYTFSFVSPIINFPSLGLLFYSESSMSFARTVAELDRIVIRMLFESYGVEKYSKSHIDSATYLLRYLKYRAPNMGETTMAFPSHTD